MKKPLRVTLIAIGISALVIQLFPVERSNPPVVSNLEAPSEVMNILRTSCYDCHSNETSWPWYSYVAPVSWLVAHDVNEGREELNFSDWDEASQDAHLIEEIYEETEEGKMPMSNYLITHPNAKISEEQLGILKKWTDSLLHSLKRDDE